MSYKGWLNSDSFTKRAFAVTGYSMIGSLLVYFLFVAIAMIFMGADFLIDKL